jgi:hypothetical protein
MGFHDRGVTAGQCHEALDEVIDEPFMMEKSELTDGALRERWPEMLFHHGHETHPWRRTRILL